MVEVQCPPTYPAGCKIVVCGAEEPCDKPIWANGLCHRHDTMQRRYGRTKQLPKLSNIDRFWSFVDLPAGWIWRCWLWKGKITAKGYGHFWWDGRTGQAYVFAYTYFIGDMQPGMTLDHTCRTRNCVNPLHLEQVTRWENVRRGNTVTGNNMRKTHCKRGHELSGDNIYQAYFERTGERRCKACVRLRARNTSTPNLSTRMQDSGGGRSGG